MISTSSEVPAELSESAGNNIILSTRLRVAEAMDFIHRTNAKADHSQQRMLEIQKTWIAKYGTDDPEKLAEISRQNRLQNSVVCKNFLDELTSAELAIAEIKSRSPAP